MLTICSPTSFAVARRGLALVLLAQLLVSAFTPSVHAAEGSISGQVRNGTAGGQVPPNLPVRLLVLVGPHTVEARDARTDGEGRFRFGGLAAGEGRAYMVSTEYGGLVHTTPPLEMPEPRDLQTDLLVYDARADDSTIRIDAASLIVEGASGGRIRVTELVTFSNEGDRVINGPIVGGQRQTLRLALLSGARDLVPRLGFDVEDLVATADGFALSRPIAPGHHQIGFSYQVPYVGASVRFQRAYPYPVDSLRVLLPEGSIRLAGEGWAEAGTTARPEGAFPTFLRRDLAAGEATTLALEGLPLGLALLPDKDPTLLLISLLLFATGALMLRRGLAPARRRPR